MSVARITASEEQVRALALTPYSFQPRAGPPHPTRQREPQTLTHPNPNLRPGTYQAERQARVANGAYAEAIDAHERLGLMADPTQALVLRDYGLARGTLSAYDVHEVSPRRSYHHAP